MIERGHSKFAAENQNVGFAQKRPFAEKVARLPRKAILAVTRAARYNGGMSTSERIKFIAVGGIASGILAGAVSLFLSTWMDSRSAGSASVMCGVMFAWVVTRRRVGDIRARLPKEGE
jgi:hypothetical protein